MESLSSIPEPTEFLKVITEKALPSNKQVLIESSYEIMSIFIEKGQKDDVLNALKMGLPHKNQKVLFISCRQMPNNSIYCMEYRYNAAQSKQF